MYLGMTDLVCAAILGHLVLSYNFVFKFSALANVRIDFAALY